MNPTLKTVRSRVHEVEVTEETSTHLKGIKRGDEGGFRSYLKKNIVGGKIVGGKIVEL